MIERRVRFQTLDNYLKVPMDWNTQELCERAAEKGGWIDIKISLPSKKKTSQENRLFHALVGQLAMYSGMRYAKAWSFDLTKRYVKIRACAHGYPYDMIEYEEQGKKRTIVEPKSVADASTVEVALLIDTTYLIAHEWSVELKQD